MKKLLFITMIAMALHSCKKDSPEVENEKKTAKLRYEVTIEKPELNNARVRFTKTFIDSEDSIKDTIITSSFKYESTIVTGAFLYVSAYLLNDEESNPDFIENSVSAKIFIDDKLEMEEKGDFYALVIIPLWNLVK